MPKFASAALIFLALAGAAYAQVPAGNVYVGYSYLSTDLGSGSQIGLNGWNASLEGKILPFFGVVADFSGGYGSAGATASGICPTPVGSLPGGCVLSVNASVHENNYLFGLRGSFSVGKIRPFAEAMVGASHLSEGASGLSISDTSFAEALGGGLDYHLIPLLSWRVEADYLQTHRFTANQNNFRVSTGLVFRF
jgi:opacity protein-like surface antigen